MTKLYSGHTAAEVEGLIRMLRGALIRESMHSVDETISILGKASDLIYDQRMQLSKMQGQLALAAIEAHNTQHKTEE